MRMRTMFELKLLDARIARLEGDGREAKLCELEAEHLGECLVSKRAAFAHLEGLYGLGLTRAPKNLRLVFADELREFRQTEVR
jgi:hypothetical protein